MNGTNGCARAAAVLAGALALSGTVATGQWSDDPDVNLALADGAGEQTQVKVAPTADGGAYVSWFDNGSGGYDVYLQRIDSGGHEQWAHNGVLIADRGFSSTQDYGLAVDSAGHALLAFRDDRFADIQITATRVDESGAQVWGPTGKQLTHTSDFVAAPKIAGTTDGAIVVAWREGSDARLQKLSAAGAPLWGAGVTISDAGGDSFSISDLHESDAGSVIVSLVKGFLAPTLYAQKYSATGTAQWGAAPLAIFDGGFLQVGNFPAFVPDVTGGAVFGWYGTGPLQCYAQHVLTNGTEAFPHNGVAASTNLAQLRVSPSVSYLRNPDEVFLFWIELNSLQSQWGLYGQKFNASGARQWTDTGKVLVPLDSTERTQVRNLQFAEGALVSFVETLSFGNQRVLITRVDAAGDFVWGSPMPFVSSASSSKSRLVAALSAGEMAILSWIDGRNDAGDVYAQNVNGDGTLGAGAVAGDLDSDGDVDVSDLLALLGAWGPCPGPCPPACVADIDGDCAVGVIDLLVLLGNWG